MSGHRESAGNHFRSRTGSGTVILAVIDGHSRSIDAVISGCSTTAAVIQTAKVVAEVLIVAGL